MLKLSETSLKVMSKTGKDIKINEHVTADIPHIYVRGVNDWVVSASFQEGFLKGSVCTEEACESGGIPRT